MKTSPAEHRRVAALADRYFAEQCARLGPIGAAKVPARRATIAKMDALAGSVAKPQSARRAQRLGGHNGAETGVELIDRFRL